MKKEKKIKPIMKIKEKNRYWIKKPESFLYVMAVVGDYWVGWVENLNWLWVLGRWEGVYRNGIGAGSEEGIGWTMSLKEASKRYSHHKLTKVENKIIGKIFIDKEDFAKLLKIQKSK